jgi:hypothetical protein
MKFCTEWLLPSDRGDVQNLKHEIRNPRQIRMSKIRKSKPKNELYLGNLIIWILNLFRISMFGFFPDLFGSIYTGLGRFLWLWTR